MSVNLRHKEILNMLEENGSVSIGDLRQKLFVSEATIRRDLSRLEQQGALKRTFGGAESILGSKRQIPLFIRESLDSPAKRDICRQAAEIIRDGDTVFIDGSSTVQYLAKSLSPLKDIIAITYNIKTAELLCSHHIKTYCVGGLLIENSLVCTGPHAEQFAQGFNVDVCILSCKGVDLSGRFTDTSEEETAVRRAFLKNARIRVLLMTGNKFGKTYLHTLCHANEVDYLFSEQPIPEPIQALLRS